MNEKQAVIKTPVKVLVVEEREDLRDRIVDILSGEICIASVAQASSYSTLEAVLKETVPDIVLAGFFQFRKYSEETGIPVGELYSNENILLYTDEDGQFDHIKAGRLDAHRILDVRRIEKEMRIFLKEQCG